MAIPFFDVDNLRHLAHKGNKLQHTSKIRKPAQYIPCHQGFWKPDFIRSGGRREKKD